jgi:hypothetical protein
MNVCIPHTQKNFPTIFALKKYKNPPQKNTKIDHGFSAKKYKKDPKH